MFIPKRHKQSMPEHMRGRPSRRCHWCCKGPYAVSEMLQVLEAPMRYHFCCPDCMQAWQQHRHVHVEWLKLGAGVRAEILKLYRDEKA